MKRYEHVWAPFCRRAMRGFAAPASGSNSGLCDVADENRANGGDREFERESDVHEFKEMVRTKLHAFAADEGGREMHQEDGDGMVSAIRCHGDKEPPPQVLRIPLESLDATLRAALLGVLGEQPFDALFKYSIVCRCYIHLHPCSLQLYSIHAFNIIQ